MSIRGDLQNLIASMIGNYRPAEDILDSVLTELTSADFLAVMRAEEIDVSNYCNAISVLRERCLIERV